MQSQTKARVKLYGNLNGAVPQGRRRGAELASGESGREGEGGKISITPAVQLSIPTVENMISFFFLSKSPCACVIVPLFYG